MSYQEGKIEKNAEKKIVILVEGVPRFKFTPEMIKEIEENYSQNKIAQNKKVKKWLGKEHCPFKSGNHCLAWTCDLYSTCYECIINRSNELTSDVQTLHYLSDAIMIL